MPKIYNKHHKDAPEDAVYIGRPGPWGNPYEIGRDGSRQEVVDKFERHILTDPIFLARAKRELKGKDLVCWCKPLACHGDIFLRLVN